MEFDISSKMPNLSDAVPADLQFTINSINFMCAFTKGLTYNQLFDDPLKDCLDQLLQNIENLPDELRYGARSGQGDIRPELEKAFTDIKERVKDTNLKARIYFQEKHIKPGGDTIEKYVPVRLRTLLQSSDDFDHLCLPFMLIQANPSKPTISIQSMDQFFRHLGTWKLVDLYTKSKCDCTLDELRTIKFGKEKGILRSARFRPIDVNRRRTDLADEEYEIDTVNLLNDHKCDASTLTCEPQRGYWCNAGDNNTCSAISD